MRTFLIITMLAGTLLAGEVHFSFNESAGQYLEVPYDTTFREFPVPIDILTIGADFRIEITFSGCEGLWFMLDDIRFPTNAFLDFENDEYGGTFTEGLTSVQRVVHPADTGYVLQIFVNPLHTGADTLRLDAPANSFPVVPDHVSLSLCSTGSVELWNYLPLSYMGPRWGTGRFRSSHPEWHYNTLIEHHHENRTSVDSIVNTTLRWEYTDQPYSEVPFSERTYTYWHADSTKISLDETIIDFALPVGETSGSDTTMGAQLTSEGFQEILGSPTFVKRFSLDGIPGTNVYFGYGLGIVREDHPGTNVYDELVGLRAYDEVIGEFEQDVTMNLGFDGDFPVLKTFPQDSSWYHYEIPITKLYSPEWSLPPSADSIQLFLGPEILVEDHTGEVQLADLRLRIDSNSILYDFSLQDVSDWEMIIALNGSGMYMESLSNLPPSIFNSGIELTFFNDWQGSTHFAGFAEYTAHFEPTVQVHPDSFLEFWMRQTPLITSIDENEMSLPTEVGISSAYPNPFNGEVLLNISLPAEPVDVELLIHDIKGRVIWSKGINVHPGAHQLSWNGRNAHGEPVSSGIYLAVMKAEGSILGNSQKLILLK